MKRILEDTLFFILLCLLLISASAETSISQSTSKPLEAIYDESTDESTVRLSKWFIVANVPGLSLNGNANPHGSSLVNPTIEKPEVIRMLVHLKYRGKDVQVPNSVNVMFDSTSSRGFIFQKNRKFIVSTDATTLDFGDATVIKSEKETDSRGMSAPYFIEELEVSVPLDQYRNILNGKKVRIQIGEIKFRISNDDLKMLNDYAARL